MTVTYTGQAPKRNGKNTRGKRSYTHAFLLQSDDPADGEYEVGSHEILPKIGSVHPEDPEAFCYDITVDNHEPWAGWMVTCLYNDDRQLNTNPLLDEPEISFGSQIYQQPVFQDRDGKAVMNSAGDFFVEPPVTRDAAQLIATISSNHWPTPPWVVTHQNAVNVAPIVIDDLPVAKGLAKVLRIKRGKKQIRNEQPFYVVTTEIHLDRDAWRATPLDQGYRDRDEKNRQRNAKNEGDVQPVTSPVPLDGTGRKLQDPNPNNGYFHDFRVYDELSFDVFPGVQ